MKLIALLSLAWRAAAAATSPEYVKERYIVKLCETSWLDREPAETAATLAESVGAKVKHVYKHRAERRPKPLCRTLLPEQRSAHSGAAHCRRRFQHVLCRPHRRVPARGAAPLWL